MNKGYKLADGSYSSEYKIGDKFEVVDTPYQDKHYRYEVGDIITFTEDDKTENPYFDDEECIGWNRLKAYKPSQEVSPQFTKSSLKDGMVVTYRNGCERILFKGVLYSEPKRFKGDMRYEQTAIYYTDELLDDQLSSMDIMKVVYEGELLWEREASPTEAQLKQQRIAKELEFAEAKRERLNAHIERLKKNLSN